MEMSLKDIVKFLVFVVAVFFERCAAKFSSLDEMSDRLDAMIPEDEKIAEWPRPVDAKSWIWKDYEFGTGVENREELLITKIEIWQDSKLHENIENWQYLEHKGEIYLAGTAESTILLYHFDVKNNHVSLHSNISVSGKIKTFKAISLLDNVDTLLQSNMYLILCIETNNILNILKWFRLLDGSFIDFWTWELKKAVKSIEYFDFNDQHKILLLYEDDIFFNEVISLVEIFEIKISGDYHKQRLCNNFLVSETYSIKICPSREDKTTISLLSKNHIILYEYKDEDIIKCVFQEVRNIPINGLINIVCFECGYMHYMATSGLTAKLYQYRHDEFVYDKRMEKLFQEIGNVNYIQSLPVNTYRDEVVLLVQLENSTTLALNWQGSEFKPIALQNQKLNKFDLSAVTIIRKFGFLAGNTFVKFKVKLNELPRPEENGSEKLLRTKAILQDILEKQESIINKTSSMIEQSYLSNPEIEDFVNLTKLEVVKLTVNNTNNFPIKLGSHNITFQEMQSGYENSIRLISKLEIKVDEIESNLKNAVRMNATDTHLREIDITGDLEIKGTLTVGNLTISRLNGISMDAIMNDCLRKSNAKIAGIKSFPTFAFTEDNLKIKKLNGIPFGDIVFEEAHENYTSADLSKIIKLEIRNNLNFSKIFSTDWEDLMQNIILKNKREVIREALTISGQMTANLLHMDSLNGLEYPHDYILKSDPEDARMTSGKTFESLTVSELQDLQTINDIDADDFIILNANQNLKHQITFENLAIDEKLQIDGDIVGSPELDIDPDLTLMNNNTVQSNTMFSKLYVSGKVYIENSINGTLWSELDDLILKDDENVIVTGEKIFLGNIHIADSLEKITGIVNGHSVQDFITLDTRQILPHLSKISGNIKFTGVSYEELKNFEEKINSKVNDAGLPICMKELFVFKEPPIIDEFSSSYINGNISGSDFSMKLESHLEHAFFEHLNVKKLIVSNLLPTVVNGVNLEELNTQKISRTGYQNLSGNVTIKHLEAEALFVDFVNNRTANDLENTVNKLNAYYDYVFIGDRMLDALDVTESIITSKINKEDLNDVLNIDYIEQFTFRTNESIENIVVEGLVNNLNFSQKINDTVLKTEEYVIISGPKQMKKLKSQNLFVDYINQHSVGDIVSADKNQTLIGPVKIKGSVIAQTSFNSTGNINNVRFQDISEIIQKVDDKMYKLKGDFLVHDDVRIENLNVFGHVQQKDINAFMDNVIFLNEKEVVITGAKQFNTLINLASNITIVKNLNDINLETFYQKAVLIDQPISVNSIVVFEGDILLEDDLHVKENLKVGTIKGINIDDLMENAVYLNRPTAITDSVTFTNVIFKSDIIVESWNGVKMDSLFTLNKAEFIPDILMCVDALVDNLEIKGYVNGENLREIYTNTFMLSTDQNITGKMSFLNNVYARSDFNSQYINNVDILKTISLNDVDPLSGNFVFDSPVILNDSLQIFGKLNDEDFSKWQAMAITTFPSKQIISGNWTVYGNVDFKKNVHGSGSLNGINLQKFANYTEEKKEDIERSVSNRMKDFKNMCQDLKELKIEAENMLYKFKSFEYLKVLSFHQKIVSVHQFELKNVDYIMVNFETCNLDIFAFTNEGFVLPTNISNISNFGYVKQYITLNYKENLYFVTIGKSKCGRNSGNIWSLQNNNFIHVLDLGNATDVEKLGNDGFVVIVGEKVEEWSIEQIYENSLEPINVIPINNKNVQFFSNVNDTLLASRDTIYDLRADALAFEEYENPFSTNDIVTFQVGIYKKEYILFYENRISSDYIFICNNDLSQRKVLQTINSQKPSSFLILNFEGFQENLLIFSENKRKIQIYEYRGIEGFKHHSSIKIKMDKIFNFKLRMHPFFVKSHCLAVIQDNKLIILEAKMYGERLDMNGQLICNPI